MAAVLMALLTLAGVLLVSALALLPLILRFAADSREEPPPAPRPPESLRS